MEFSHLLRSGRALGAILLCTFFISVTNLPADASPDDQREEFHQTYPLQRGGHIELDNINGAVHISTWDRDEVKVDAIKTASTKERLDAARVEVDASPVHISIRTKYKDHDLTFTDHSRKNPATVEYTLTVPRAAQFDEIKLINGALDISGVSGAVRASCINGKLVATRLSGRAHLSSVNGRMEAAFDQVSQSVELDSVNGRVELTLPSDVNAELQASTISGGISNDFGLRASHHIVGHNLHGQLGNGGTKIKLSNVNGGIEIHHASDGRTLSPAKNLGVDHDSDDKDDEDDKDDI